jgi:glucose dehydrogenase
MPAMPRRSALMQLISTVTLALAVCAPLSAQEVPEDTDWLYWGGDARSTHYAPLEQVDRTNVDRLEIVWRWKSENFGPQAELNWEVTPLAVDGVLYFTDRRDTLDLQTGGGRTRSSRAACQSQGAGLLERWRRWRRIPHPAGDARLPSGGP